LGVKAPINWVGVFCGTVGAKRKASHAGVGAVIRDGFDDGEARTAIRAVDKGVAVAPIGGVEELPLAIWADG